MAYNQSSGSRDFGDLKYEDDTDTQIDWDQDSITFKTNDVARFVIDNNRISGSGDATFVGNTVIGGTLGVSGNVGFGTSNPEALLHLQSGSAGTIVAAGGTLLVLESSEKPRIHFQSANAYGGSLVFGSIADNDEGQIDYDNGSDRFLFKTGGNTKMAILGDDVGIGTANPTHKLTVAGDISGSGVLKNVGAAKFGASVFVTGSVTAGNSFIIGSANINETDLEKLDGITDGTATANKAVVVDGSKNIATLGTVGCGAITSTGTSTFANISGSGTLKAGTDVTFQGLASGSAAGPGSFVSVDAVGKLVLTESAGGSSPITTYNNAADNRIITSVNGSTVQGEANLNFDGSILTVAGAISGSGTFKSVGAAQFGSSIATTGSITTKSNISGSGLLKAVGAAQFGSTIAATGSVTTKSHLIVSGNTYLGTGAPDSVTIMGLTTASLGGPGSYLGVNAANQLVLTESAGGSSPITTYNTAGDNRVITSVNSNTVQGEANFTFSGTRLEVTGAAVINGELRGKQVHVTHHAWTTTSTNTAYVPFYDLAEHTSTSPGYKVGMIAPFDGRLVKVMFRPQTGQSAAVTVGVHTGSNTDSGVNTTAIETVTVTPVNDVYTTSVYNFTGLSHFTAESFVGVSIDPNNTTNACTAICVWEFNTTTL